MPAALRFGYGFDMRNPEDWRRPWPDLYAQHLEFIAWLETLGFGNVFLAEHHGIDDGYLPSPLVMAAAIAARTKSISTWNSSPGSRRSASATCSSPSTTESTTATCPRRWSWPPPSRPGQNPSAS